MEVDALILLNGKTTEGVSDVPDIVSVDIQYKKSGIIESSGINDFISASGLKRYQRVVNCRDRTEIFQGHYCDRNGSFPLPALFSSYS
jgi:hypothetical protein